MAGDRVIEKAIRAIFSKDSKAASSYLSMPDDKRKQVIRRLDGPGRRALTVLIKAAKKKAFSSAHKRFLEIAKGPMRTPVYLVDETLIEENMRILRYVKDRTGCKVLHALKAYASFATFPIMAG
ncbi:MAG TPA: hypothetical protein VJ373_05825, partial [Desulfatiglandales bacterium]|nr:hypothetical protein [Desulfatiglandales bacterium]